MTEKIEGIPSEMTACRVVEFHKPYEIGKVATPKELGEYDLLVKTCVASYCHTDSMVLEGMFPTKLPNIGSHEGTGTVVQVGSKVKGFKKGDRVMSGIPKGPCGSCVNCHGPNDWEQYCENMSGMIGVFIDGCFADYHISDSRYACHVPDNVSLADAAPLACAGITIYRAIVVANVKEGGWLAIVGAGGGLGHLGVQMGLAQGLKVIAIDARDEALDLCRQTGAKYVFDARQGKDKIVEEIQKLTGEAKGVDATINVSEHETAAPLACAITKMHGTMVQISQPAMVNIPFQELIFRDIRVVGSLIAGQEQSQAMLDLVGKAGIKVEVNKFNGLNEVPKMFELSHSGKMKGKAVCVVDPSQL